MILEFDRSKKIQKIDQLDEKRKKESLRLSSRFEPILSYFVEWFTSRDKDGKMLKVESSRE